MNPSRMGRIDVHSHLLPGIDDGCANIAESLKCAQTLVDNGYSRCFCTPHIWPSLPNNTIAFIEEQTALLQKELDTAGIPLRLSPGGELNLRPNFMGIAPEQIVSYGMRRRYVLFDFWADRLPSFFEPSVRWLQSLGLKVILAHPERIRAIQDDLELLTVFERLGVLLQGNLQCFSDPPNAPTRQLAEKCLKEEKYFLLGSDTHGAETVSNRMTGLRRAIELAGENAVWTLTHDHPKLLADDDA